MQVSAVNVHPVKSTAIRSVPQAELLPWGLADDRAWMVVDGDGAMISARTDRLLFTITARTRTVDAIDADLELTAPDRPVIVLDEPTGPAESFTLHGGPVSGVRAAPAADAWLRSVLDRDDVGLVWCADPTTRRLNPDHSRPDDSTAYADGYPVLLTTTASLAQLGTWMRQDALERGEDAPDPVPMQRFRPNLVIDDVDGAFVEDRWRRVRIGDCVLRVAEPCDRCVMTLIDPDSLQTGKEPIRTLARHRRVGSTTLFGANLIPDVLGVISVGDRLEVLDAG